MDSVAQRKIPAPAENRTKFIKLVVSHFTEWARSEVLLSLSLKDYCLLGFNAV
jgi:hypothetical protein